MRSRWTTVAISVALAAAGCSQGAQTQGGPSSSATTAPAGSNPTAGAPSASAAAAATEASAPVSTVSPTTATSAGSDQARIISAVRHVAPSVVALNVVINGTQVVPANPFAPLFGGPGGMRLRRFRAQASGSGFVYDRSGLIVTNAHVVHNASRIQVLFQNGDRVPGQLFAEDVSADLALVKVSNYAKLPAPLALADSAQVQQGEWAIAIGEPFELQQTVTVGVVSGFNRDEMIGGEGGGPPRVFKGLLQTSAPINPGNSGGPLVDIEGRLIGVNQSTASPAYAQGIGFAIPVSTMKTTAAALVQHPGTHAGTSSGFIGVQLLPLDVNVRRQLNYVGNGVAIAGVISGSSADAAGLEPGDVIQQVNGTPVSSPSDVTAIIGKLQPGQTVTLRVWSGGTIRRVVVRVGQRPLDGM